MLTLLIKGTIVLFFMPTYFCIANVLNTNLKTNVLQNIINFYIQLEKSPYNFTSSNN